MGFQGDVAGIGLGELLQGLARGGREGVLTLRGGSVGGTVGLEEGQLYLLPEPDEDPEVWRRRCERAWVKDPNERIDILRMSEIAYAARLEAMFQLLDSEGVHFRFEPGPLPDASGERREEGDAVEIQLDRMETGTPTKLDPRVPVHCPGVSVEFLLLEYARLSDNAERHGDSSHIPVHDVPRVMSPEAPSPEMARFWDECDGMSSLIEIADRLGWPMRQCRTIIHELWTTNALRLADARELLVLAQRELAANRFARAASRLAGWVVKSPPGPPPVGDAQLLIAEWQKGKLPVMLASMDSPEARTLLKRLELVEGDPAASIERWKKLREFHRHDAIAELRQIKWQLAADDDALAPSMADLLKLARKFQDLGQNVRAGVILRGAAGQQPETTSVRLELGQRMIAVDLVEDGAPWVLEACRTLISSGLSEKAVGPLRTLIAAHPGDREARALLGAARTESASGKRYRRNSIVALAVLLILSLVALVKVQLDQDVQRRLDEISNYMNDPQAALGMLEQQFPKSGAKRVREMRDSLYQNLLLTETRQRDAWLALYEAAELECKGGDQVLGLERAMELPPPPTLQYAPAQDWSTIIELLDALAARLEQAVAELGPPRQRDPEQIHAEERLFTLVDALLEESEEAAAERTMEAFRTRLGVLEGMLTERGEKRAEERRLLLEQQLVEKQNMLLEAARSHNVAGDLERAVHSFRELTSMEGSETIARVLADEISSVEAHWSAVVAARSFARDGKHDSAWRALSGPCPDLSEHLLPWRVETWPTGARVRLPDGSVRVTPFSVQSAFGEPVLLRVTLEGHEPLHYSVDGPSDLMITLSRLPERWWEAGHPVGSLPLAVGDDHVCADRGGEIVRMSSGSEPAWKVSLDTLGGVARTPVFLPRRPGSLLVVSEEGSVWFVNASDGSIEGPWMSGNPPVQGPTPTATGASVTFMDGRVATWESELEPEIAKRSMSGDIVPDLGADAGLAVLRRRAMEGNRLESPWSPYMVTVKDDHYAIRWEGRKEASFTVRRTGNWEFLAWEAPNSKIPGGRLWISDGAGLRAFEP